MRVVSMWLLLVLSTVVQASNFDQTIQQSPSFDLANNLLECKSCENSACKNLCNSLLNSSST